MGIGFVPYSPINRGFLGGCINEYTVFDSNNDNRQTLPRFQPEAMRANMRIVNALQAFGRTRGMTSAQVALGWLLQKAPWIVPIPGTTKLSHLEENLRTLEFALSPEEWKELEWQLLPFRWWETVICRTATAGRTLRKDSAHFILSDSIVFTQFILIFACRNYLFTQTKHQK